MKKIFKKYIPPLVLCSFLIIDFLVMVLMTVAQTSYGYTYPEESKIYELFSVSDLEGIDFYMNGVGDIQDNNSKLTKLLSTTNVKKQSKIKSYVLLFTLGKDDFVLYGKTVYKSNDGMYSSGQINIFEKKNTIYVVRFDDSEENFSKEEFAVYLVEDENFASEILKFKSTENKYYVYSPAWVNDLMSFNLTGKLFVLVVILEIVAVFISFKKTRRC